MRNSLRIAACVMLGIACDVTSAVRSNAADLCGAFCRTPDVVPGQENRYETQLFAGLQWQFGDLTPELDLGVRRTRTSDDDNTFGGKADIAFKIDPSSWQDPTVRFLALAGKRQVQGELGFGFTGLDGKPLIATGLQGPYVEGGANYIIGGGLKPFIGVSSLSAPAKPRSRQLTCPAGYKLVRVLFASAHAIDGQECDLDLSP